PPPPAPGRGGAPGRGAGGAPPPPQPVVRAPATADNMTLPSLAPAPRPVARPTAPPRQRVARPPAPETAAPAANAAPAAGQVVVKPGDTATRIALANKSAGVSLDQMLAAMLASNPNAFSRGNVNRLRVGSVLNIPAEQQAAALSPSAARKAVVVQSHDFNSYRRKLASLAPSSTTEAAQREASGKVATVAPDSKGAAPAPDKLTLSKGAVGAGKAEDTAAKDMAQKDAKSRAAELNKNIDELNKLATASGGSGTAGGTGAKAAAAPGVAVAVNAPAAAKAPETVAAAAPPAPAKAASTPPPAPAASPAPTTPVATPPATAPAPAAASTAAATTPTAATPTAAPPAPTTVAPAPTETPSAAPTPAAPPKRPPPPPPPPPPEPDFIESLMENPLVPGLAVGLVALLGGLGLYRMRQRRKRNEADSSFLESKLQPDSFFNASGGQKVDTTESGQGDGTSMMYSPSQLDAGGDVDPVAEADVYLAYGRDLQAEEILKEAMRTSPTRVALHGKLCEIYVKRRDLKAFGQIATDAYKITKGEGPVWKQITDMGQDLDPENPLYQPGGKPPAANAQAASPAPNLAAAASTMPMASYTATTAVQTAPLQAAPASAPVDLDLDFSAAPSPGPAAVSTVAMAAVGVAAAAARQEPAFDLKSAPPAPVAAVESPIELPDLEFPSAPTPIPSTPPAAKPKAEAPAAMLDDLSLDFDLPPVPASAPVATAKAPPSADFDLGGLSLDLGDSAPASVLAAEAAADPLATKLSLAEEFHAIGDDDGARVLAEEVLAEASGNLKIRAQKFLSSLA
ncbi:MAG TPA: FimV/HubP family polar landmark protein, partial [Burkholderiaceae bacterium]|nr:FimV/HubP family polar landmark protein [Burkholderiaceae bacterium]